MFHEKNQNVFIQFLLNFLYWQNLLLLLFLAKERIMNNLKKFDTPKPPLPLQTVKAPVPVISSASLVSQKEAIQLMRMDLNVLQRHAK